MNLFKLITKAPKSNYKSYYEIAKYELTWQVLSFVSIGLIFITIAYYFFDFDGFYASVYGCLSSNLIWAWFYKKRDFFLVGIVFTFHSVFYLGLLMFILSTSLHVIEYVWFVMFTLYSFFVLGRKMGYLVISVCVLLISVYLVYFLESNFINLKINNSTFQIVATILNIIIAFFIIAKIITQFKDTRLYAEKKFANANRSLQEKNRLIEAQNEEKTIMLKEIHHRVKNNLQVVSSLIRLQSFETDDVEAKKMFDATVGRVIAMALIHEKMYQNDNLSKINITEYLKSLANDIVESLSVEKNIKFNILSDLDRLGNRTIVPLALIFNELISNSIKHAFNIIDVPMIKIRVSIFDEECFVVDYQDNGVWDNNLSEGFGVELINTFVEQLDGVVDRVSNETGTKYTFKLKNIE
jgi:two-component sensor histidine kinase